jgi:hypothetical protein
MAAVQPEPWVWTLITNNNNHLSIRALEPNQRNIHWVPALIPRVKLPKCGVDHPPPPNAEVRMCRALFLRPQCALYGNYGMNSAS